MSTDVLIVLCTAPEQDAAQLADLLLDERLVACANLLPAVESRYLWEGRREIARETLMVLKTSAERVGDLQRRLAEAHPYEVPEILVLPVQSGLPAYLDWVAASCRPGAAPE